MAVTAKLYSARNELLQRVKGSMTAALPRPFGVQSGRASRIDELPTSS
jgi:hypothetical protein